MDYDSEKIDDAALALLYLTLHDQNRVWKSFDWDTLGRLHSKGYISSPIGKTKSVLLSDEGQKEAKRLCDRLFG